MAVNDEYIDKQGRPRSGVSSQAGLNAFAGGRAKSLPSVPAPGQPGSRFNAVVVDRGVRMSREEGVKAPRGTKTLPLNMPLGMIQGIPSAIMNPPKDDQSERTVAGEATRGFAGGFLGGVQNRMFAAAGYDPSWRANNEAVVDLNTKLMAATAETIALMDRDIETMTDPADIGARLRLIGHRAQTVASLQVMQESMAHDQVNVNVRSGAHTGADVDELRQKLAELDAANGRMRSSQVQRGVAAPQGQAPAVMQKGDARDAATLNAEIMAASEENIELLHGEIYDTVEPADAIGHPLVEARSQAVDERSVLQESMARGESNTDVRGLRQTLDQLHGTNGVLRASQAQRWAAELDPEEALHPQASAPSSRNTAPVRNADGMTLADLTAMAPGEDPLPGMGQPLIVDVLNEVQGTPPRRAAAAGAKRSSRSAVMSPDHAAALKELDRGGEDLEVGNSIYSR